MIQRVKIVVLWVEREFHGAFATARSALACVERVSEAAGHLKLMGELLSYQMEERRYTREELGCLLDGEITDRDWGLLLAGKHNARITEH